MSCLKNNIKIHIKTAPVSFIHQLMHEWVFLQNNIKIYIKTAPVLFIHQLMHQWVVLQNNIKIYINTAPVLFIHQLMHHWVVLKNNIKICIKTAPTCFGVTVTPSSWCALICASFTRTCGPDSSVGIETVYGLDRPWIESRCWRVFPHLSRPALMPTVPPVQCVPGLSSG